jgi:hypothetical protein
LLKRYAIALCLLPCASSLLHAQAKYTASRAGDLQVGVDFVAGQSDYDGTLKGVGLYTTFDFTNHFGAEFDLHQANMPEYQEYERTYELSGRYYRNYGRLAPYVKGTYGRGVLNFKLGQANLAYNLFAIGGGADFRLTRYLNLRGDYEYQFWSSFPPNGLTPQLLTIGVAYHFPGGLRRGKHY